MGHFDGFLFKKMYKMYTYTERENPIYLTPTKSSDEIGVIYHAWVLLVPGLTVK